MKCEYCNTTENVIELPVVRGAIPLTGTRAIENNREQIERLTFADGGFFPPTDEKGRVIPHDPPEWKVVDVESWAHICFECL